MHRHYPITCPKCGTTFRAGAAIKVENEPEECQFCRGVALERGLTFTSIDPVTEIPKKTIRKKVEEEIDSEI
jgi:Zn-finger nucleic acid-binding protein